jgi:hypothetical protein
MAVGLLGRALSVLVNTGALPSKLTRVAGAVASGPMTRRQFFTRSAGIADELNIHNKLLHEGAKLRAKQKVLVDVVQGRGFQGSVALIKKTEEKAAKTALAKKKELLSPKNFKPSIPHYHTPPAGWKVGTPESPRVVNWDKVDKYELRSSPKGSPSGKMGEQWVVSGGSRTDDVGVGKLHSWVDPVGGYDDAIEITSKKWKKRLAPYFSEVSYMGTGTFQNALKKYYIDKAAKNNSKVAMAREAIDKVRAIVKKEYEPHRILHKKNASSGEKLRRYFRGMEGRRHGYTWSDKFHNLRDELGAITGIDPTQFNFYGQSNKFVALNHRGLPEVIKLDPMDYSKRAGVDFYTQAKDATRKAEELMQKWRKSKPGGIVSGLMKKYYEGRYGYDKKFKNIPGLADEIIG